MTKFKNSSAICLNISLSHDYKIADLNTVNEKYSNEYRNSPELTDQGIYLNAKIAYGN